MKSKRRKYIEIGPNKLLSRRRGTLNKGYQVVDTNKFKPVKKKFISFDDVYVPNAREVLANEIREIIATASKNKSIIRVLEGDVIVDIYPTGEKKVVGKLARKNNSIRDYTFKLK